MLEHLREAERDDRPQVQRHGELDDDETGERDIGVAGKREAEAKGKGDQQADPGEPAVETRLGLAVAVADPARDEIAEDQSRRHRPAEPEAGFGSSEEHTSELQSLMRISYAGFFLN